MKRSVVALAVCVAVLAALPAAATVSPGRALMIGDSLTHESRTWATTLTGQHPGWQSKIDAYTGTAPCDWLAWLPTEIATFQPTIVGIETAGNNTTPCMGGAPIGSTDYYTRYQTDLAAVFATATGMGTRVVFFTAPAFKDPTRNKAAVRINQIATALAYTYHGVSISGAVRTAIGGTYTDTKPCLASETPVMGCTAGRIVIRTQPPAVDAGLHLCPTGLVWGMVCESAYSSGEYRFGRALAGGLVKPPAPKLP